MNFCEAVLCTNHVEAISSVPVGQRREVGFWLMRQLPREGVVFVYELGAEGELAKDKHLHFCGHIEAIKYLVQTSFKSHITVSSTAVSKPCSHEPQLNYPYVMS